MVEETAGTREGVALDLLNLVLRYDERQLNGGNRRPAISEDELLRLYARCLQTIKDCKVPGREHPAQ